MTEGTCYAYYPYSSSASYVASIPVSTTNQDDYLYATAKTVNAANKSATLTMQHALAAVRLMIKKGDYSGTGELTGVSVQSSALGTLGSLNAKTDEISDVQGKNTPISMSKSLTLSTET